ncbi:MAG: amidophosphoribosyltransferase [Parcubacteria group bacterium Gr01-1014_13]|nr:MAG: amidophosphoribosyltransferase [Parcubacteria group bacterium Gr01-1014_13]
MAFGWQTNWYGISMIHRLINKVKDLLFPKFCVNCEKEGVWLCEACLSLENLAQEDRAVANLDGITALFNYGDNTISKLIQMFKYNYLLEIADIFEKIITETKFNNTWTDFVIIPVPLHARRERERGLNQAEVLAMMFAKKFGLSINKNLNRVVYTVQQAKLSGEERRQNLKDAFVFKGGAVPEKVLLVDDVYTTGATMQECARVLKNNGVKVVWGLVLAKG